MSADSVIPDSRRLLPLIYGLNATLLLCHEIDSAYWKEWEMFRLPGGIQGFVLIHLVLIGLVLWGFDLVAAEDVKGRWFSLLLALGGIGGGITHGIFLLMGEPQFRLPVSIGLIVVFLITSTIQLVLTIYRWKVGAVNTWL